MEAPGSPTTIERGVHALAHAGQPSGEERWSIARTVAPDGRVLRVAHGEQETRAPHPFPSRIVWTAHIGENRRIESLDIDWQVGPRRLEARHASRDAWWQVTITVDGHTRTQEGDYPTACSVLFGSPIFHQVLFEGLALAPGAEHEVPALIVGPPWMAVEPGTLRVRCTDAATRETALGTRALRRIELGDLSRPEAEPLSLWIDEDDRVVESFEGNTGSAPWMTLAQWEGPAVPSP